MDERIAGCEGITACGLFTSVVDGIGERILQVVPVILTSGDYDDADAAISYEGRLADDGGSDRALWRYTGTIHMTWEALPRWRLKVNRSS